MTRCAWPRRAWTFMSVTRVWYSPKESVIDGIGRNSDVVHGALECGAVPASVSNVELYGDVLCFHWMTSSSLQFLSFVLSSKGISGSMSGHLGGTGVDCTVLMTGGFCQPRSARHAGPIGKLNPEATRPTKCMIQASRVPLLYSFIRLAGASSLAIVVVIIVGVADGFPWDFRCFSAVLCKYGSP